jgi:metal-dependent HD superfamily phosphatase/phosphodiesterase
MVFFQVRSVLQERVYRSHIRDTEHLKARLAQEWRMFRQNIVDAAVKQWRVRLKACVKAAGGHFEHQLS